MFTSLFKATPPVIARDVYLHNTLAGTKEKFEPKDPSRVTLYSCGPTVYDYAHIGNLRAFVAADILRRVLIRNGYVVEHTMNLTDFGQLTDDADAGEDKMMKGLKREGLPVTLQAMKELGDKFILAFQDDMKSLNNLQPDTYARASEYVKKQIALIKTLDTKGYTYETSDGVYFDISKFPSYGQLGNINLEELKSGARVEVNSEKRHPADFAVWKKSDLGWKSSWGTGFPGWHIECSAMAISTLGKSIDIHTGGEDLAYTHHNAEIAQSEAATGKPFVKYWLHNAFVNIDAGAKISKSKGNAITLRQLQDRGFTGEDYRYWLLTAHYRSPINFSWSALKGAKQALFRLKRLMYEEFKQNASAPNADYLEKFDARLADDLDTPGAIATLWDMLKDNTLTDKEKCGTLMAMDDVLDIGLSLSVSEGVRALGVVSTQDLPEDIQTLIDKRDAARAAQNWLEADTLRDILKEKGYEVEDSKDGTKVSKI